MGLIFKAKGEYEWTHSHAMLPLPLQLDEYRYRIFFGSRNKDNKTQIGYIEIDIRNPKKILYLSEEPLVRLGNTGLFDDAGVFPHYIIRLDDKLYLYYTGWMQGVSVPYYAAIGLVIINENNTIFRTKAPIFDRDETDPYSFHSPCIMQEDGKWRLWYSSTTKFEMYNDKPMYYYHIKYAESKDGIRWERKGIVAIDFKYENETRIARPCVLKEDGIYKMWYSYIIGDQGYRIGYAESKDGIRWERKDEQINLELSEEEWDSEMMAYPFVFKHKGKKYMLYCGNGYGKEGFGYAIEED